MTRSSMSRGAAHDRKSVSRGSPGDRRGSTRRSLSPNVQTSAARLSALPPAHRGSRSPRTALFFRGGAVARPPGIRPHVRSMVNVLRAIQGMKSDSGQHITERERLAREEQGREEALTQQRIALRKQLEKGEIGETDLMAELLQDRPNLQYMADLVRERPSAINISSVSGRTAAHYACVCIQDKSKMEGSLRILLDAGASLYVADNSGATPLLQLRDFETCFGNNILKVVKRYGAERASRLRQRVTSQLHSAYKASGGVGGHCVPSTKWADLFYSSEQGALTCCLIPEEPAAPASPAVPASGALAEPHVITRDGSGPLTHIRAFSFPFSPSEWVLADTGLLVELRRGPAGPPVVHARFSCPHLAYAASTDISAEAMQQYETEATEARRVSFPSARADMRTQANLLGGTANAAVLLFRGHLCFARVQPLAGDGEAGDCESDDEGTAFDPLQSSVLFSSTMGKRSKSKAQFEREPHPLNAAMPAPDTRYELEVYMLPRSSDADATLRQLARDAGMLADSGTQRAAVTLEHRPVSVVAVPPRGFAAVAGPEEGESTLVWDVSEPTELCRIPDNRGKGVHCVASLATEPSRGVFAQVSDSVEVWRMGDHETGAPPALQALLFDDGTMEERYSCTFHPTQHLLVVLRTTTASRDLCVLNLATHKWSIGFRFKYRTDFGEFQPKHVGAEVVPAVNHVAFSCDGKTLLRHNASLGVVFAYDWDLLFEQYLGKGSEYINVTFCPPPSDGFALRADGSAPPPTGLVTLCFTDVQNSTSLWEHAEGCMAEAIDIHNRMLREEILEWSGYEVKTEGDAFMVTFASALDGLNWCLSVQRKLLLLPWPPPLLHLKDAGCEWNDASRLNRTPGQRDSPFLWRGLRVRMGLHTGKPSCALDPVTGRMDYFGPVVNLSARVSGRGKGGQIVLSDATFKEVGEYLFFAQDDDGISERGEGARSALQARTCCPVAVESLGEHRLKGIAKEINLYQVLPWSLALRCFDGSKRAQGIWSPIAGTDIPPSGMSPVGGVEPGLTGGMSFMRLPAQSSPVVPAALAGFIAELQDNPDAVLGPEDAPQAAEGLPPGTGPSRPSSVEVERMRCRKSLVDGVYDSVPDGHKLYQVGPTSAVSPAASFSATPTLLPLQSPQPKQARVQGPEELLRRQKEAIALARKALAAGAHSILPQAPKAMAFPHSQAARVVRDALQRPGRCGDAGDLVARVDGLAHKCAALEHHCAAQREYIEELEVLAAEAADPPDPDPPEQDPDEAAPPPPQLPYTTPLAITPAPAPDAAGGAGQPPQQQQQQQQQHGAESAALTLPPAARDLPAAASRSPPAEPGLPAAARRPPAPLGGPGGRLPSAAHAVHSAVPAAARPLAAPQPLALPSPPQRRAAELAELRRAQKADLTRAAEARREAAEREAGRARHRQLKALSAAASERWHTRHRDNEELRELIRESRAVPLP